MYSIGGDKRAHATMSTSPLYVSDLDGTLLQPDGTLSEYSQTHLNRLIADGLQFSVATARSTASMRQILRGVDLSLPVVNLNGALLSDLHSGHHHAMHALVPDVCEQLHACMNARGHSPFVSATTGQRDRLYYEGVYNEGMQWFVDERQRVGDPRLMRVDDVHRSFDEHVLALTVIAPSAQEIDALRADLLAECADSVQVYVFPNGYSDLGDVWLTVSDALATKDRGIRLLAEHGGFALDALTVFGDGENDVGMFEMAPNAVAVANAVPPIRQRATEWIGDHGEDSVVKYLQRVRA